MANEMTDRQWRQAVEELLALFWEDGAWLMWQPQPPVQFSVICSDTFMWACADAEPIELPDDLAGLRAASEEFPDEAWPLLWACRKRGMRPMNRFFRGFDLDDPFIRALRAAGPERESTVVAP